MYVPGNFKFECIDLNSKSTYFNLKHEQKAGRDVQDIYKNYWKM